MPSAFIKQQEDVGEDGLIKMNEGLIWEDKIVREASVTSYVKETGHDL